VPLARACSITRRYAPLDIIAEAEEGLQREMDFREDARFMQRFHEAFRDWPTMHIPAVFEALSTDSGWSRNAAADCGWTMPLSADKGRFWPRRLSLPICTSFSC